jgi:hypothetical protein
MDPSFTLRTYTHLMDNGLGEAAFLDTAVHRIPNEEVGREEGNRWATHHPETAASDDRAATAEIMS